ncbi:MAG: 1-(5-phosphoribosyl)-5-[(5-phosphoribosylamino)methylideneamino]imidazole-4-carboxamide isomerase [Rhodospirillaceae bacterium]|nr:1-(5-phosphoribosyl)-5-[(5-phosphoribosylamino)methylideneamino]imidazole-4-carboxamide isomerase [Rhodospirillaceae bacterium]|tara:strand:- start:380 stop:1120 length:741 start_codon:yes stop_codon:yes gene_type:complete
MIIYPAIDLKDGKCVRLQQGNMDRVTVFNDDPASQARAFEAAGAAWLHIVDLNGAFEGRPVNGEVVERIIDAVKIPVQLGGGIRTEKGIEDWLDRGVTRVILGTVALKNPGLVRLACDRFSERVALGVDAKDGMVAVEGWAEVSKVTALELAGQLEDCGAAAIIYTDIGRDGVLRGPNIEATVKLASSVQTPVIASGGVSGAEDIKTLAAASSIAGAIIGRALYDGRVSLAEAIAAGSGNPMIKPC